MFFESFQFGLGSFISSITVVSMASIGLIMYVGSKYSSARAFVPLALTISLWSLSMLMLAATPETEPVLGELLHRLTYVIGMMAALTCFYFGFVFASKKERLIAPIFMLLILLGIVFTPMILKTDIIFSGTEWKGYLNFFGVNMWAIKMGSIPFLFDTMFSFLLGSSLYFIHKKIKSIGVENPEEKKAYKRMFKILLIGFVPGSVFSMILPSLGMYQLDWVGPASLILFVGALAYSMMKYNEMNVKVVTSEILILTAMILLFINIFL